MLGKINIIAVSRHPASDQIVRNIRVWCNSQLDRNLAGKVEVVTKELDLESAVNRIAEADADVNQVLIPIGFHESDVTAKINQICPHRPNLEIVIRPPRPSHSPEELDDTPSCSLLDSKQIVNVQNTIPALRKSMLRLVLQDQVHIIRLENKEQMRNYFLLRYRVWKEMGYLPSKGNCKKEKLELDYTDIASLPIGAFDCNGKMIGCARLVFAMMEEISDSPDYPALIRELIDESGSACLKRNFRRPRTLDHPFELLKAFDDFKDYYQQLVVNRVSKAEVSRVIVEPDSRHVGLGEVLVDTLMSLAGKQQVQQLFLACNEKASGFYERSGFYVLKGLCSDHFGAVNSPSIAMACDLTKRKLPTLH